MAIELLVDALSISGQRQIYVLFSSDSSVDILRSFHAYLSVCIVLIIYSCNSNGANYLNCMYRISIGLDIDSIRDAVKETVAQLRRIKFYHKVM